MSIEQKAHGVITFAMYHSNSAQPPAYSADNGWIITAEDLGCQLSTPSPVTYEHLKLAGLEESEIFDAFDKHRDGTLSEIRLDLRGSFWPNEK